MKNRYWATKSYSWAINGDPMSPTTSLDQSWPKHMGVTWLLMKWQHLIRTGLILNQSWAKEGNTHGQDSASLGLNAGPVFTFHCVSTLRPRKGKCWFQWNTNVGPILVCMLRIYRENYFETANKRPLQDNIYVCHITNTVIHKSTE